MERTLKHEKNGPSQKQSIVFKERRISKITDLIILIPRIIQGNISVIKYNIHLMYIILLTNPAAVY